MQYFLCLADEKNVTRAARRLNIVQPALSMQIAKLEAELGQKLFDRSVQGMTLTSAGEALVRLTAPIVRDAEYARQEIDITAFGSPQPRPLVHCGICGKRLD